MAQLVFRKRLVLAKIESTYGTDSTPTGSANAILLRSLTVRPIKSDMVERTLVRNFIGGQEQLQAAQHGELDIEIELAGSGTAASAPGYDALLRAAGFSVTNNGAAVTGTATAGTTSTITLAVGASAVDDAYLGFPISITAGANSGYSGIIVDYNGTTKVATVARAATGAFGATSQYSIGVCNAYRPVSGSFESVSIYFYIDGVLHKFLGSRADMNIGMTTKGIPTLRFTLMGLYGTPTDTALPTATFTQFQQPLTVNASNTSGFALHGVLPPMAEMSIALGNKLAHRTLVNQSENIVLTDREVTGSFKIEADNLSFKNWFSTAAGNTKGTFQIVHGTSAGNIVAVSSPNVQIFEPTYEEMDGITMLNMTSRFTPTSSGAGNDELVITTY